jgi:phosphoglycolate phosphatase-like HAD superfamily hydrolase
MIGDREEDALCAAAAGIDFMWADVWRDRFKKGFGELDLSSRHISREILLKFLAT